MSEHTYKSTGKRFGRKVVWVDENGDLYERMNPNGVKLGRAGKYIFRRHNEKTAEYIRQNVL
jgi:hypothetical protein